MAPGTPDSEVLSKLWLGSEIECLAGQALRLTLFLPLPACFPFSQVAGGGCKGMAETGDWLCHFSHTCFPFLREKHRGVPRPFLRSPPLALTHAAISRRETLPGLTCGRATTHCPE